MKYLLLLLVTTSAQACWDEPDPEEKFLMIQQNNKDEERIEKWYRTQCLVERLQAPLTEINKLPAYETIYSPWRKKKRTLVHHCILSITQHHLDFTGLPIELSEQLNLHATAQKLLDSVITMWANLDFRKPESLDHGPVRQAIRNQYTAIAKAIHNGAQENPHVLKNTLKQIDLFHKKMLPKNIKPTEPRSYCSFVCSLLLSRVEFSNDSMERIFKDNEDPHE